MATHGEDVEVKFGASIEGLTAGIQLGAHRNCRHRPGFLSVALPEWVFIRLAPFLAAAQETQQLRASAARFSGYLDNMLMSGSKI